MDSAPSTVQDFIDRVRFKLADYGEGKSLRWSDARIKSLINEGIEDLTTTRLFTDRIWVPLLEGVPIYEVDNYTNNIERLEFMGTPLIETSYHKLDKEFGPDWKRHRSNRPTHAVFEYHKAGSFRIYPTPSGDFKSIFRHNQPYGIVTKINYTEQNVILRVVSNRAPYGDINASPVAEKHLLMYSIRYPEKVLGNSREFDFIINTQILNCLQHFVVGNCYRDNMDTLSRQMGLEELQLYERAKETLVEKKSTGNLNTVIETEYRSMG